MTRTTYKVLIGLTNQGVAIEREFSDLQVAEAAVHELRLAFNETSNTVALFARTTLESELTVANSTVREYKD